MSLIRLMHEYTFTYPFEVCEEYLLMLWKGPDGRRNLVVDHHAPHENAPFKIPWYLRFLVEGGYAKGFLPDDQKAIIHGMPI